MCDTLCSRRAGRTLFAKNSDRPVGEVQLVHRFEPRAAGGDLRTQYLTIPDAGAAAVLGSQPTWLWGFEHGLNEHRVAIGNERVYTIRDDELAGTPPALIGMDLVRLGLERARTAGEALDVITSLIERHGQAGICEPAGDSYSSSFLIADPETSWVLETCGRTWAARAGASGEAISNRLSLGSDWTRSSPDLESGSDFQQLRSPAMWTSIADVRLAVTEPAVRVSPASVATISTTLRDHGSPAAAAPGPLPGRDIELDGTGVTVCMHVRGYSVTAASMIAELATDPAEPVRAWVAPGSPCVSVYIPVFPFEPANLPAVLGDTSIWAGFDRLRSLAEEARDCCDTEASEDLLRRVRAELDPIEMELWAAADATAADLRRGDSDSLNRLATRIDAAIPAGLTAAIAAAGAGAGNPPP